MEKKRLSIINIFKLLNTYILYRNNLAIEQIQNTTLLCDKQKSFGAARKKHFATFWMNHVVKSLTKLLSWFKKLTEIWQIAIPVYFIVSNTNSQIINCWEKPIYSDSSFGSTTMLSKHITLSILYFVYPILVGKLDYHIEMVSLGNHN